MSTGISKAHRFFLFLFSDYPGEKFHKRSWAFWEKLLTVIDRSCQYSMGVFVLGIKKTVLRNRKYFYKNFISSDHPCLVFLSNFARPKRFMKKFLYGQIIKLPPALSLSTAYEIECIDISAYETAKKLKDDGVVILPERYIKFADYLIEEYLLKKQNINIQDIQPEENKKISIEVSDLTQPIVEFIVDPFILSVFALYLGYQPYVMDLPNLSIVYPSNNHLATKDVNPIKEVLSEQGWHFDTVNLIQCTILLNDVEPEDSHMEIVKGAHKSHRMNVGSKDYLYSEEYINDKYEIVHCCGKKGTIYLFDPNAPHRLHFAKNSMRVNFKTMYSPGNDSRLLRSPGNYNEHLLDYVDFSQFTEMQKEALFFLHKNKVLFNNEKGK